MNDALTRYIEAVTGLTKVTRKRAEQLVKNVTRQGTATTGNVSQLVEQLLERSQENRDALASLVRAETKKLIGTMGLATRDEVDRLKRQITELRRRVEGAPAAGKATAEPGRETPESPAAKAAKKTARKTTAKKAQKTTKKTSKKTTAKKAQKTTTKKTTGEGAP